MTEKVYTPTTWAKDLIRAQGDKNAHSIANTYRQPMFGKDQDVVNPFSKWYQEAYQWLEKNHPLPKD